MTVIQMSDRELSRLRVMIDLADGRLTLEAAGMLMGICRRQVFWLRRAFATAGASGLTSRKRGRPSNRKRGEAFQRTVLALVREHPAMALLTPLLLPLVPVVTVGNYIREILFERKWSRRLSASGKANGTDSLTVAVR